MFRSVIRPTNNSEMGHHYPRLGSPPIAQTFPLERSGVRRRPRLPARQTCGTPPSADTMSPTKRSPFNEHHKTTTEHGNQSECSPAEIEAQQTNSDKSNN